MDFSGWKPFPVEGRNARTADGTVVGSDRPPGDLHLGAIIHHLKEAAGESVGPVEGDQPGVRMQEGFLWETTVEYLTAGLPVDDAVGLAFKRYCLMTREGVVTQVRVVRDNIHMTPDALDRDNRRTESYKATRRTLRHARTGEDFAANFWAWHMAEMAYCLGTDVQEVRWVVWWIAGDYSRGLGSGPQMLEAVTRFEQAELEKNWTDILRVAERLRPGSGA